MRLIAFSLIGVMMIMSSCAQFDDVSKGTKGAVGGAAGGALIGQAIGRNTEATLIGAAVGTMLGYIVGNEMDKQDKQQLNNAYERGPSGQPVTVIFDGSEVAQRALAVAIRIARAGVQSLTVFLVAASADDFTSLREQTTALAGPVALRFHELVDPDIGQILAAVRSESAGTLVLGMNKPLISPESVELLRKRLSCPAVLVK